LEGSLNKIRLDKDGKNYDKTSALGHDDGHGGHDGHVHD